MTFLPPCRPFEFISDGIDGSAITPTIYCKNLIDLDTSTNLALYAPGEAQNAAQQVAASGQIDALFIPDQAEGMPGVAAALGSSGIKTQLLGTGVWERFPGVEAAPAAGGVVRRARQFGLQRDGPALPGEVQQRADPAGDALL